MIRNFGFVRLSLAAVAVTLSLMSPTLVAADQLERIKQNGELVLGTEARFPPFEFVENGKIVGYTSDMLELVMAGLPGVKVRQLDLPWQGILSGLETSKFDYAYSSMTATQERSERYALSLPIADASVGLLRRAGDPEFTELAQMNGKVIGSQAGSGQLSTLMAYRDEVAKAGVSFEVKEYIDYSEAYADLGAGRIDAVANALPNLLYTVKQRPDAFAVLKDTLGPKLYFVWAARKDAESASLAAFFDSMFAKLNQSGEMAALQKKWFGFAMDVPFDALPQPEL
jgi:polar amino acid transport system substrate-binding protein